MINLSKTGIQRLREAAEWAAKHPHHFDMRSFVEAVSDVGLVPQLTPEQVAHCKELGICGSTACIAGTVVLLNDPEAFYAGLIKGTEGEATGIDTLAYTLLEAQDESSEDSLYQLFYRYISLITAANVVEAIEAFIQGDVYGLDEYLYGNADEDQCKSN